MEMDADEWQYLFSIRGIEDSMEEKGCAVILSTWGPECNIRRFFSATFTVYVYVDSIPMTLSWAGALCPFIRIRTMTRNFDRAVRLRMRSVFCIYNTKCHLLLF